MGVTVGLWGESVTDLIDKHMQNEQRLLFSLLTVTDTFEQNLFFKILTQIFESELEKFQNQKKLTKYGNKEFLIREFMRGCEQ